VDGIEPIERAGERVGLAELERVPGIGAMSTPMTSNPARW
jgi:hypothetical protein